MKNNVNLAIDQLTKAISILVWAADAENKEERLRDAMIRILNAAEDIGREADSLHPGANVITIR